MGDLVKVGEVFEVEVQAPSEVDPPGEPREETESLQSSSESGHLEFDLALREGCDSCILKESTQPWRPLSSCERAEEASKLQAHPGCWQARGLHRMKEAS
eukprot:g3360.t1